MSEIEKELEIVVGTSLPEVQELDDQEFQIPQVENVPTLESILDEDATLDEDTSFFLPDDLTFSTLDTEESDSEAEGLQKQESDEEDEKEEHTAQPSSLSQWVKDPSLPVISQDPVLQIRTLRGISAQIISAVGRIEGGRATAMAVCGILAVGTTRGQLLIFDINQALKLCLGSQALGTQHGPISALGFSTDGSSILCGFAKGQILQWDVESGKLLRSISNVVPVGNVVSTIKFTSDPTVAVCSDSMGSVFELHFKRSLGMKTWDSRCLFSSERGAVCCLSPLCLREDFSGHIAAQRLLLAMVSLRKLMIVCQKPELKVIHTSPLVKAHADCMPSVSWRFLQFRDSADPVLAFSQGCCFSLYQLQFADEDLKVIKLIDCSLPYEILNFKWLSSNIMLVVDAAEKLHALDRETGEELQELQLEDLQLVSMTTAGSCTRIVQKRTTHQSVCAHRGKMYLLGDKAVQVVSLKTWEERLDDLVKQDRHDDALSLAWKFYEGSAKAVVGLPAERKIKEEVVACKVGKLLLDYVEISLKRCPGQGKIQVMEEHFQKTLPLCVTCCVKFNKTELLFGELFEKLMDHAVALTVLLESLQPHICAGQLTSIPPLVMKDLVGHYTDQGMTNLLDTLIPQLDVRTLDLHQVVSLSRQHGLTDALIYVFNKGMNDYITPIEELVYNMAEATQAGDIDGQVTMGNKVLVYISCCLSGRAYPFGLLPDDMVQTVKTQVFTCLTKVHVKDDESSEGPYLLIRTLLKYNTKEFLNVLALTFEELYDKQAVEFHQRIIDILLQVMLESADFSPSQIGSLFTFLARQLAKTDTLFVNHQLFHQALDFLCNPEDKTQQAEKQQALLDLLQAGGAAYFKEAKLLAMAEAVSFYQVCEFLYEQKCLYHRIVTCYLKDPVRKGETLHYLQNVISSVKLADEEKVLFQNEIFCNLQELLAIDPRQTTLLILQHFPDTLPHILETLQQDSRLLFDFLHGVFNPRVEPWPFKDASLLDHSLHETYLELLCQSHPSCVIDFLKLSDMYRPEEAVEITRKHKVRDALAYLLEKQGKTQEAFCVLMECVKLSLPSLLCPPTSMECEGSLNEETNPLLVIQSMLRDLVAFCQRVSGTLDTKQREDLWFSLLDFLMSPGEQVQCPLPEECVTGIKNLTKEVIESMTSYIPLMDILQWLMQDSAQNLGSYGEVKTLISGIIDAYIYEKTLMEATSSLFSQDLHWSLCSLRSSVSRGLAAVNQRCEVCAQMYSWRAGSQAKVIVFSCGHVYHYGCLQNSVKELQSQGKELTCFRCHSSRKRWFPITPEKEVQDSKITELDKGQISSSDWLKRAFKNPSRISILMELTRQQLSSQGTFNQMAETFCTGITEQPDFKLNLVPPPLID